MKTIKTSVSIVLIFLFSAFTFLGFAENKTPSEVGREIAQAYLDAGQIDENWKDSNPFITEEYVYYTDKESPSYKEYKISCDKNPNCGWIIVNIDGDDVSIPIASTQGSTNFEVLNDKLTQKILKSNNAVNSKNRKLYYFSPFEQYIIDEDKQIESLDPTVGLEVNNINLQEKIEKLKIIKASQEFQEKKLELKRENLTSYSHSSLFGTLLAYAATTTIPDTFVPGASTSMCGSRIPCYKFDATFNYTTGICKFGCVPTGLAMIFGYHDRQGNYPNLITGSLAKDYIDTSTTDTKITTMINSIRTTVGTFCNAGEGSTPAANAKLGVAYAVSKGYASATGSYETGSTLLLLNSIKVEINAGRPVLVGIQNSAGGHAVVAYGYSSDTTSKMIRVNYGQGRNGVIQIAPLPASATPSYNADINVNAVSLGNPANLGTVTSITRIKVGG